MTHDMGTPDAPNCAEKSRSRECSEETVTSLDVEQPSLKMAVCEDVPPNGGYGWVCVACTFWINAQTWGINGTYGVFLAYYLAHDRFPGTSSLEYAFVGGLSMSQALLVSPLATYTTRVYGTRTTLLIGVFLEALALINASFAQQMWQLFLTQGVCYGVGMGFLFVGSVGIVPQWFTTRRNLANGISVAGSGLGGMMYSLAASAMIEKIGIGWTLRILGTLAFVVTFVCAMLLKDRNKAVGAKQSAFDYALFARFEFLLFLGWGFFSMLGYVVLLYSLPNYAVSIGLSPHQGSILAALLNLGQGIGQPLVGFSSDAVGCMNMAGFLAFACGLLCLVFWIFAESFGVLVFFALIVGTVAGNYWSTVAPVAAEAMGLKELPSALSLTWLVLVIPTLFAEPVALKLRQHHGNIYMHTQLFVGFMYVTASICMWRLRAWKVEQIAAAEQQAKTLDEVDVVSIESTTAVLSTSSTSTRAEVGGIRRLFQLKKV